MAINSIKEAIANANNIKMEEIDGTVSEFIDDQMNIIIDANDKKIDHEIGVNHALAGLHLFSIGAMICTAVACAKNENVSDDAKMLGGGLATIIGVANTYLLANDIKNISDLKSTKKAYAKFKEQLM